MERVENVEVFENDIQMYLQMFCEENNIEDLKKESQAVWNSCLRYIYTNVFKPNPNILKLRSNFNIDNNNIPSNCNMYNYDLLLEIADYYIYSMCMKYDKEVSIIGYEALTGVSQENIYNWANKSNKLSTTSFEIYKKLSQMREESLSNKLVDGKRNPVGIIACLNRHYSWSSPFTADANRSKSSLPAAELPKLGDNSNTVVHIAQGQNVADNP